MKRSFSLKHSFRGSRMRGGLSEAEYAALVSALDDLARHYQGLARIDQRNLNRSLQVLISVLEPWIARYAHVLEECDRALELEDFVQEAFLRLPTVLQRFDLEKYGQNPQRGYVFLGYFGFHLKDLIGQLLGRGSKRRPAPRSLDAPLSNDAPELTLGDTIASEYSDEEGYVRLVGRVRAEITNTLRPGAARYTDAILDTFLTQRSIAQVAKEYGINHETLRRQLRQSQPRLAARMRQTEDGHFD